MIKFLMRQWLIRRAKRHEDAERYEAAIADFTQLMEITPTDRWPLARRAVCRIELGLWLESLADVERFLAMTESDASAWELKGRNLTSLERWEESLAAYDRALEIEPGRPLSHLGRGAALSNLNRNREAIVDFDRFIERCPLDKNGFFLKAVAFEFMGEPEEGLKAIDQAIRIDPKSARLLGNRARLLAMANRHEEALTAIDVALSAGFPFDLLRATQTYQFVQAGRFLEALPGLDHSIQKNPSRGWYQCRAKAYLGLGDPARANADYRAAARLVAQVLNELRRTGIVRNAVLIQAGNQLFAPGDSDGAALVLLTFDDAMNSDIEGLKRLASALFALKQKPLGDDPVLRATASAISNDHSEKYRRQPLPDAITEGVSCYAADLSIYREFLPERRLTQSTRVIPVLAEPGEFGRMEMLPWPGSLADSGG